MEDRQKLKPWFLYSKLFITTLSRLPPIAATVYRGIKADLTNQYKPNSYSIWWGVSSYTDNIEILQSEQFCGKTGMRTIFVIKCLNGRSIRNHSYYPQENEIILMPGSYFQVDGCYDPSDEFHIVQLREIKPPYDSVPRTDTNQWRQTTLGICLEGICTNTDCIAYQREVIIPIGFRKFNVLTDATASISKCSLCSAYSKVSKIGFSHCQWRYRGIKQRLSGEQPISCMDEWCDIGEYSIFKHEPQETYA